MNENLQTALAEILNKAISGIDTSVEFMQSELPDVITQLLTWYSIYYGIVALVSLFIIVGVPFFWFKFVKWNSKNNKYFEFEFYFIGGLLSFTVVVIGIAMMNLEWLQILIAPKIWLMEYAAALVK